MYIIVHKATSSVSLYKTERDCILGIIQNLCSWNSYTKQVEEIRLAFKNHQYDDCFIIFKNYFSYSFILKEVKFESDFSKADIFLREQELNSFK